MRGKELVKYLAATQPVAAAPIEVRVGEETITVEPRHLTAREALDLMVRIVREDGTLNRGEFAAACFEATAAALGVPRASWPELERHTAIVATVGPEILRRAGIMANQVNGQTVDAITAEKND